MVRMEAGRGALLRSAATALALLLGAAGPALAQTPVKIGVVEGLSGPPAIVDFGESYLQGIKLALEDYKAKGGKTPIELVVYDDEANPQRAVSVVQRLIQNDRGRRTEVRRPAGWLRSGIEPTHQCLPEVAEPHRASSCRLIGPVRYLSACRPRIRPAGTQKGPHRAAPFR